MRELNKTEINNIDGAAISNALITGVISAPWVLSAAYLVLAGKTKWNKEEGAAYNMCFNAAGIAAYPLNRAYVWGKDSVRGLYDGLVWGLKGCK